MIHKIYSRLKSDTYLSLIAGVFIISLASLLLSVYSNYELQQRLSNLTATPAAKTYLPTTDLIKKIKPDAPTIGNPNAKVVVVEFEDFQCPFCRKFEEDSFAKLKAEYIDTGKIKFIHQDLAFLGQESNMAAEAARCALDQNKFWEYRAYLFDHQGTENSGSITDASLKKIASTLGLNSAQFGSCYDGQKYKNAVTDASSFAGLYGISGTPTFVINGQIVTGAQPVVNFENIINQALNIK